MAFGSGQVEPKWVSVSSYCKRHGLNRGPVQCRKRWSNLAGDFKKIKEWETQQMRDGTESFWVTRNDLRRERKLPGFFDREVYDVLDGVTTDPSAAETDATTTAVGGRLGLALAPTEESGEDTEAVFDSGRSAAAEDGLFSDFEQEDMVGSPGKEAKRISATMRNSGTTNAEIGSTSEAEEGRKRKRFSEEEEERRNIVQCELMMDVVEKNGKMLTAQLEAQNNNYALDREQTKHNAHNLLAVLNKLAGALARIADKL